VVTKVDRCQADRQRDRTASRSERPSGVCMMEEVGHTRISPPTWLAVSVQLDGARSEIGVCRAPRPRVGERAAKQRRQILLLWVVIDGAVHVLARAAPHGAHRLVWGACGRSREAGSRGMNEGPVASSQRCCCWGMCARTVCLELGRGVRMTVRVERPVGPANVAGAANALRAARVEGSLGGPVSAARRELDGHLVAALAV
jgi:hypothetical protein